MTQTTDKELQTISTTPSVGESDGLGAPTESKNTNESVELAVKEVTDADEKQTGAANGAIDVLSNTSDIQDARAEPSGAETEVDSLHPEVATGGVIATPNDVAHEFDNLSQTFPAPNGTPQDEVPMIGALSSGPFASGDGGVLKDETHRKWKFLKFAQIPKIKIFGGQKASQDTTNTNAPAQKAA